MQDGPGVTGGVSANAGRIEQNDPSMNYTGKWFLNTNPAQSGGTAVLATDPGARDSISFNGPGLRWIAYRDAWSGVANIYIAGAMKAQIDTYSPTDQAQATAYDV